jgi:hypothetical protein
MSPQVAAGTVAAEALMLSMSQLETAMSTALVKVVAVQVVVVALDAARKGKSIPSPCSSLECPFSRPYLYCSMGLLFSIPIRLFN